MGRRHLLGRRRYPDCDRSLKVRNPDLVGNRPSTVLLCDCPNLGRPPNRPGPPAPGTPSSAGQDPHSPVGPASIRASKRRARSRVARTGSSRAAHGSGRFGALRWPDSLLLGPIPLRPPCPYVRLARFAVLRAMYRPSRTVHRRSVVTGLTNVDRHPDGTGNQQVRGS